MRHTITRDLRVESAASGPGRPLTARSGRVYRLGPSPLGAGGQAQVWPATDPEGTTVAVKLALPGAQDEIRQEARLLRALTEAGFDGAVPCLDTIDDEACPGFVMPLYEADLDTHIARLMAHAGPRALESLLSLVATLARTLGDLHGRSLAGVDGHLVHRDVKPENVLVDRDGRLLLADFGGSVLVAEEPVGLDMFGSPLWAPFDQMLPDQVEPNPSWDTYAVGVCLFWWLTGDRPAYQADPTPMLTERGATIWKALGRLADPAADRKEALRTLARARLWARAVDLVDVRGHGAIQDQDRAALMAAARRLAPPEVYGEEMVAEAARRLAEILARGLSPLSHPSPPNRYWKAAELAEDLEALAARLAGERKARSRPTPVAQPPQRPQGRAALFVLTLGALAAAALAWSPVGPGREESSIDTPLPLKEEPPTGTPLPQKATRPAVSDPTVFVEARGDLPAFRIHRTEVTEAEYAPCVAAQVCGEPRVSAKQAPWRFAPADASARSAENATSSLPVVGVTWEQADKWCTWAGGRLPTEAEWAQAASEDGPWPWGPTEPDCARVNGRSCGWARPLPAESLPAGASPAGALNLAGNVWEWTRGTFNVEERRLFRRASRAHRVLRGGGYDSSDAALRTASRRHDDPGSVSPEYGFRCVYETGLARR